MTSIKAAFQKTVRHLKSLYPPGEAASIAAIVFEDALGIKRFQSPEPFLHESALQPIRDRLLRSEPVQYILGQADFYGLKLNVNPAVLIPRQETEELVYWILETIRSSGKEQAKILDIGAGSGCIPVALGVKAKNLSLTAIDVSPEALEVAKGNAQKYQVSIEFHQVDILEESTWSQLGRYDIIVSNPPYIPHREAGLMPSHVTQYEPYLALFVTDEDPLIFYRKIARFAQKHLRPGGFLFFELNEYNAGEVGQLLENDFENVTLRKDISGKERMVRGQFAH